MGITSKTTGLDGLDFNANSFMDQVEGVLRESLEQGEVEMKQMIETRGTGRTWKKAWSGSSRTASTPGRVDTGEMRDAVEGKITERTTNSVTGQIGWEEGSEAYYAYQDQGFSHRLAQREVPGMGALRDASESTVRKVEEGLDRLR